MNRFGMFIHWGVYSLTGYHEQAFARANMKREDYEPLYHSFDPREYDPERWVLLAKEAGMEYICFTAKHHDGFCMWDTKETDYSIMNTPYGKDTLKMLSEACGKYSMPLSVYYSCPDWHHDHGYNPASTHQWCAKNHDGVDHSEYIEYVRKQVRELCTGYGPLYTFFWDIPPKIYEPSLNEMIRELQPGIFINDRGYDTGDFSTPEREYESENGMRYTRMTEACNSVGVQAWGYRKNEDFYSVRFLTASIDQTMARGGSYLLNVGPDPRGVITPEYESIIRRVGDWYLRMDGALSDHEEDTFNYYFVGVRPIVTKKGAKSCFHFPEGLVSSAFSMCAFPRFPKSVKLLNTGNELRFSLENLPNRWPDPQPVLHVSGIPIDDLSGEAIVIEIEW